jgi:hypothetical protein
MMPSSTPAARSVVRGSVNTHRRPGHRQ